jgi:hypothetical protein
VPANFYTDGFHPNDAGYALLAQQFVTAALSNYPAPPQAQCTEQGISTASSIRQAVPVGHPFSILKRY